MKLLMLQGLPASGKSTYAKELAQRDYVRVNKDDLRSMLHGGKWSGRNEREVIFVRNAVVENALAHGRNVVVDDTNFNPVHQQQLQELAKKYGAEFELKFIDTPLEVCYKRDAARANGVGETVIRRMYNQYLRQTAPAPEYDPDLPDVILCDIDGTLAHMGSRSPYEWEKVGEDKRDVAVADILRTYDSQASIVLVSGRDSVCRPQTEDWLRHFAVGYDDLIMRAEGDNRKDSIVKRELYEKHIKGNYNVLFVLDDRNQVVDMWRHELGLKVLQVAEGDF